MTKKQLQYGILFFTLFIDMLGFGIVIPVLPRYGEYIGATSWEIGWLIGIFSLAQFVTLPFWGRLSDRIGRKPVLIVSVFGTACGYLLMGWSHTVLIMMIGRAIDGVAGGNMSTIQACVTDITQPEERSKAMGALGAAYGLGFIFGPALGGWSSSRYGFSAPMFIAAGLAIINVLLIIAILPESLPNKQKKETQQESKHPSPFSLLEPVLKVAEANEGQGVDGAQKLSVQELLDASSTGATKSCAASVDFKGRFLEHLDKKVYLPTLITFFFFVTGFSIMTTLLALFAYHRYGMKEQQIGYIYAMIGLIAIAIEGGLFSFLSKCFGDRLITVAGSALLALGLFLMPLTREVGIMIGLCAMMALGDSLLSPALPSIISHSVKSEWQGAAFGVFQSAGSLARFLGPLLAGFFLTLDQHGPKEAYAQTAFWIASGLLLLSLVCALKIPKQR